MEPHGIFHDLLWPSLSHLQTCLVHALPLFRPLCPEKDASKRAASFRVLCSSRDMHHAGFQSVRKLHAMLKARGNSTCRRPRMATCTSCVVSQKNFCHSPKQAHIAPVLWTFAKPIGGMASPKATRRCNRAEEVLDCGQLEVASEATTAHTRPKRTKRSIASCSTRRNVKCNVRAFKTGCKPIVI